MELDGEAVTLGFDPLELPADRFFNWVWCVMMRGRDESERTRLAGELYLPLPGQDIDENFDDFSGNPWSDDAMGTSFLALQSQLGGDVR